jgi:hypothetical protein
MVPTLKPDKVPPPLLLTATVCAAGLLPPAVAVKVTAVGFSPITGFEAVTVNVALIVWGLLVTLPAEEATGTVAV